MGMVNDKEKIMKKAPIEIDRSRNVICQYLRGKHEVKVTRARHIERAIMHAVMHMQANDYDAFVCQVWNGDTGKMYAEIKRTVKGNIKITFRNKAI